MSILRISEYENTCNSSSQKTHLPLHAVPRYICIVLLKWSVPFISLSFLDYLFQYLSPIGRLYLAEKEVHEIPPCVLVQFVVQSSESFKIAVDVRFHHIHEDVVHLVISALLRYRLAVSLCHVGKG